MKKCLPTMYMFVYIFRFIITFLLAKFLLTSHYFGLENMNNMGQQSSTGKKYPKPPSKSKCEPPSAPPPKSPSTGAGNSHSSPAFSEDRNASWKSIGGNTMCGTPW
mmetsp:Transcript_25399/g.48074  ORF Transcript_25399/g.48074 Transcript_25399/m.48074 type:complete len:106 (-) Transcript_25399:98-415(-)